MNRFLLFKKGISFSTVLLTSLACNSSTQFSQDQGPSTYSRHTDGVPTQSNCELNYYQDLDGDGYGSSISSVLCPNQVPGGWTNVEGDPDDFNHEIYPNAKCSTLEHGKSIERVRYLEEVADTCISEIQKSTCRDGVMSDFDGSYSYATCNQNPTQPTVFISNSGGSNVIPWETLTCNVSGGSDREGPVSYLITWDVGGVTSSGTEREYLITTSDRGKEISCSAVTIDSTDLVSASTSSSNTLLVDTDLCNSNNLTNNYGWSFSELRDGTEQKPLAICTEEQYLSLAKNCGYDSGVLKFESCPYSYELLRDLDFSTYNSLNEAYLIGSADYWGFAMMPYTETFNGNMHKISNLTVSTNVDTGFFGLFSYGNGATIINLELENIAFIRNELGIGVGGGIIGHCQNSIIDTIKMTLTLETDYDGGALVGATQGCSISNVHLVADVTLNANTSNASGNGLIGTMSGDASIIDSFFDINLTLKNNGVRGAFVTDELNGHNLTLQNLIFKGNFELPASSLGFSHEVYVEDLPANSIAYVQGEVSVSGASNIFDTSYQKNDFTALNTMVSNHFDITNTWEPTATYPKLRVFE